MTRKEEIINAFLKLGTKKGFDCVSLQDIAGEVGLKKASIFSHFKSREEIESSAVSYCLQTLSQRPFQIDPKAESKEKFTDNLFKNLSMCFSVTPCDSLLAIIEQKRSYNSYYEDLSKQIDLMICARLTVALDFCVQRSWSDISDTDSYALLITPYVREILMGRITSFPKTELL